MGNGPCVKTDKASGILNDANDYANEIMNNPAYPLELFQRVITVCLETMKIIKSLPNWIFENETLTERRLRMEVGD